MFIATKNGCRQSTWHSPQLKQGDSCFNHYGIVWYHAVSQYLTQCPQARLYCFRMPYGAVFYRLMPTAFAVLYLKYLCLHWYPCYVWYGSPNIPLLRLPDFLPADSCTHSKNKFDCLDTSLALWLDHFHTRQTSWAYQRTSSKMQNQCTVPVYDYISCFLLSNLQCRWFGFHESAW